MRTDSTFIINLNCENRVVPNDAIEGVLYGARDWLRFSRDCYLIRTNLTANEWYTRVRAVLDPKDNILVLGVDLSRKEGWVTQMVTDWILRDEPGLPLGQ